MKKIRVYIVDDDLRCLRELKKLANEVEDVEIVGSTTDPHEAEKVITSESIEVDVAFLDVQMPEMDGFILGEKIKQFTDIVYVTAYLEHGPETYRKRAFDFLLKPVSIETFKDCIHNIQERLQKRGNNSIEAKRYFFVLTTNEVEVKIFKDQVVFIEAMEKYVKIKLINGTTIVTYLQISEVEEEAKCPSYLRVSRSCIINVDFIKSKMNYVLTMDDGTTIYVKKTYKKAFRAEFQGLSLRTKRNNKDGNNVQDDSAEI